MLNSHMWSALSYWAKKTKHFHHWRKIFWTASIYSEPQHFSQMSFLLDVLQWLPITPTPSLWKNPQTWPWPDIMWPGSFFVCDQVHFFCVWPGSCCAYPVSLLPSPSLTPSRPQPLWYSSNVPTWFFLRAFAPAIPFALNMPALQ